MERRRAATSLCLLLAPCLSLACLSFADGRATRVTVPAPSTPHLHLESRYASEGTCRRIVLDDTALTYTYNATNAWELAQQQPEPSSRQYAQANIVPSLIAVQRPHWTDRDLVTDRMSLTPAEVASLARLIRSNGFLNLHTRYNDTPRFRFNATRLSVTLDGKTRSVTYEHGPMPPAFQTVQNRLFALVNAHNIHKIP